MVKRSTKSKSKRTSIRKKHKIMDKVKSHNRKKRRQERKKARENKAKGVRPPMKDPGVPSMWPFREEFLKEMAFEKQRILNSKKIKKEQSEGGEEAVRMEVEALARNALEKGDAFNAAAEAGADQAMDDQLGTEDVGGREHFKDFRKVVELADVVVQVLDARDPNGCRSNEVESYVRQLSPQKRFVLLLNKTDLVPRNVVEAWLKYLRQFAPTIAFKCSTQRQNANLGHSRNRTMQSASSVCLGADHLIQLLKNYTRNANIRTAITVGLVGVPNVGKSSVINSLKRNKVAQVGNRPGVTTSIQEVHLDKQIRLLDSPGVIYDKSQGALQGVSNAETLLDPIGKVQSVLKLVDSENLKQVYGFESTDDVQVFLEHVARKKGRLRKGGIPDVEAAARMVIQDWNKGKILFYTMPPEQSVATEVRIVDDWAKDFSLEGLFDIQPSEAPVRAVDDAMEVSGEDNTAQGALEAFCRMAEYQRAKKDVNQAAEALVSMNLDVPTPAHPPSGTPAKDTASVEATLHEYKDTAAEDSVGDTLKTPTQSTEFQGTPNQVTQSNDTASSTNLKGTTTTTERHQLLPSPSSPKVMIVYRKGQKHLNKGRNQSEDLSNLNVKKPLGVLKKKIQKKRKKKKQKEEKEGGDSNLQSVTQSMAQGLGLSDDKAFRKDD